MYKHVQSCSQCGAGLTLDDMRRDNCPYCQTVYPHKSMAQQHAETVAAVMGRMQRPGKPTGAPPGVLPPPGAGPYAPYQGGGQPGAMPPGIDAQLQQAQRAMRVGWIISLGVLVALAIVTLAYLFF